jgi:hypothetical protein
MDFEALGKSHQCGLERKKIMQNVFLRLIDFSGWWRIEVEMEFFVGED